nr:reverse transcriptase domain-containing protein [Tanacetum cinerariifolium]
MTNAVIKALIAHGIATALAEYEANRGSGNGDDSHDSGRCCLWHALENTHENDDQQILSKRELALLCGRMFPEVSHEEKYVGGLLDIIQGSVMASKPKTMQDAIEFATELMDQKICTFADRQAENKRKLDDNSRNNENQQQSFKKQNLSRAYTVRPGALQEGLPEVKEQESGKSSWEWSFVSTAFSSLIDIIPTTLNHGYNEFVCPRYAAGCLASGCLAAIVFGWT